MYMYVYIYIYIYNWLKGAEHSTPFNRGLPPASQLQEAMVRSVYIISPPTKTRRSQKHKP